MYKPHSANPSKFGSARNVLRSDSGRRRPSSFRGRPPRKNFSQKKNNRSRGERIDFSRFIKKGVHVEEKPYVSQHTFADFPFNPVLNANILRAGYMHPRPIQDQAIPVVLASKDVFGMANTGTGKTAAFLLPLIEKISQTRGKNM